MFSTIGAGLANPAQVAENMPASLTGMRPAFLKPPAQKLEPRYGLSFRFKIKLNDISSDLGRWQSCQGLKVEFKPQDVKSGGDYTRVRYLPGEVSYPKIVLKRAVDKESSQAVQSWLRKAARSWITGTKQVGAEATITLHDSYGDKVLTWHVTGVRPASWSGPDLDATASKVAIETLELVHEGFEVVATSLRSSSGSDIGVTTRRPVTLCEAKDLAKKVEFWNAPTTMTVKRNTRPATVADQAKADESGADAAGHEVNATIYELPNLYIVVDGDKGKDLVAMVNMLTSWMEGKPEKPGTDKPLVYPPLLFAWDQFKQPVVLTGLTTEYVRFATNGWPIQAKVKLTLTARSEEQAQKAGTNPTSGGIPGRSAHTLLLDENLPLLAQEYYGSPSRWRDIAEANGIDDPLRQPPGSQVFLPAAAELVAGR